MPAVFQNNHDILEVGDDWLSRLKIEARQSPTRRARLCLHCDNQDKVHEMLIVFCRDSLMRPHRHNNKSESFHVIEGRLAVVIFDDAGTVIDRIEMAPQGNGKAFMYRLSSTAWHTVVPQSEYVAIHETTAGPFVANESDYAPWAPETGPALQAYIESLEASAPQVFTNSKD